MAAKIGITANWDKAEDKLWLSAGYYDGVLQAGGLPLLLPLTDEPKLIAQMVEECDGFLFSGGKDISPARYGETIRPDCGPICPRRDAMEFALLDAAARCDMPVLGICRGLQLFNVALGGTLHQDLNAQRKNTLEHRQAFPYDKPFHEILPHPESVLADIIGSGPVMVNSYHHQAIKQLAPSLEILATSRDGVIEAVYQPDRRFLLAVQWHPETILDEAGSRQLFTAFLKAAEQWRNNRRKPGDG